MEENEKDWIRGNRHRLGWTRAELAEAVDISEFYVAKLEQGTKTASPRLRVRLREIFEPAKSGYNVGDVIEIEGLSFRIVDVTISHTKAPTVELRSLIEELENK